MRRELPNRVAGPGRYRWRFLATTLYVLFLLAGCGDDPTPTPPPQVTPIQATATATPAPTRTPTVLAAPPVSPLSPLPTPRAIIASVPIYTYRVVNIYPHDANAFTQGLIFHNGTFYEGAGLYGRSSLRQAAVESGEVLQQRDLAPEYFGEGIALWNDRIIQLTWREQTAFVYNRQTFEEIGRFSYPTEGWGLTYDGQRLIMSDGSDTLYFRDPETFAELGRVQVSHLGQPVTRLNELEYINGEVYANVWQTDTILRIDPTSGQVVGIVDLAGLLNYAPPTQTVDVLNGIAYDPATERLFVTGKLWPAIFEIELVQVE